MASYGPPPSLGERYRRQMEMQGMPIRSKQTPPSDLVSAFPGLETANSTSLHKLYVANKVELTKHISAAAGAAEKLYGDDDWFIRWYEAPTSVTAGVFGCNDDSHNLIEHQTLATPHIAAAVPVVLRRFEQQRRRFSWVVGPMDQPQLEIALRNRDFLLEDDQPAMVADLEDKSKLPPTYATPSMMDQASHRATQDYQIQLMLLEQQNKKRLMMARANCDNQKESTQQNTQADKDQSPKSLGQDAVKEQEVRSKPLPRGPMVLAIREERLRRLQKQQELGSRDEEDAQFFDGSNGNQSGSGASGGTGRTGRTAEADAPPSDLDLQHPRECGFRIRLVEDASAVASWVRAWAYEASAESADVRHWTNIYKTLVSSLPSSQFQMFAAKDVALSNFGHELTIGTGYVHFHEGIAAIHCIVVRPGFQRQGVGKSLTEYGMALARDRGYKLAMLTASQSGMSIFRKLGFKDTGRVKLYAWRPLKDWVGTQQNEKETKAKKTTEDEDNEVHDEDEEDDEDYKLVEDAEKDDWELVD